ncbi:MAG: glycosyl hydrolase [Pyrinomonadaceae bacterium]
MGINSKLAQIATILLAFVILVTNINAQWQKQTVETKAGLRGLSVVNEKVVWASGTSGTFLRTIDGGKTWKVGVVPDAEKLDFRDVEAFDANTAYLLSIGNGETSRIYKTTDGGETWRLQFKNTNEKVFLDAFAFWDEKNGIAMGDPVDEHFYLLATNDGGQNWKPLSTDKMPPAKTGEAAFAASGTCLVTNGKSDVYLVSGGNATRVIHSNNRGASWIVADSPIVSGTQGSGIFSIAMFDAKTGVIVGGNYEKPNETRHNVALTNDAGKTWTLGNGLNGYRSGVAFVKGKLAIAKALIAVGSSGSDISVDSGKTWVNLDKENYNAIQAKGFESIWAVGANGLVAKLKVKNSFKFRF